MQERRGRVREYGNGRRRLYTALQALSDDSPTVRRIEGCEGGDVDVVRQQRREYEQARALPSAREVACPQRAVGASEDPQLSFRIRARELEGEGRVGLDAACVVAGKRLDVRLGAADGEDGQPLAEGRGRTRCVGDGAPRDVAPRVAAVDEMVERDGTDDQDWRRRSGHEGNSGRLRTQRWTRSSTNLA